jgi:hypothetical protein
LKMKTKYKQIPSNNVVKHWPLYGMVSVKWYWRAVPVPFPWEEPYVCHKEK